MALSIFAKRLSEKPLGSRVKVTYGDGTTTESVCGKITERDDTCVVIVTDNGEECIINYSLVLLVRDDAGAVPPPPPPPPPPLPPEDEHKKKDIQNQTVQPERQNLLHQQEVTTQISAADRELTAMLQNVPKAEQRIYNGAKDSFFHGVKNNDRNKMVDAAKHMRGLVMRHESKNRYVARLCGLMLYRANEYDAEMFARGGWFLDAALTANRGADATHCGAFAVVGLLRGEVDDTQFRDLLVLLAKSIAASQDVTGLRLLYQRMPESFQPHMNELIQSAYAVAGLTPHDVKNMGDALSALEVLLKGDGIREEATRWLADETPEEPETAEPEPNADPEPDLPMERQTGTINQWNWYDTRRLNGEIEGDDGTTYQFNLEDVEDEDLKQELRLCTSRDLNGVVYRVEFFAKGKTAVQVQPELRLVARARAIAADSSRADRFEVAYELCRQALEKGEDVSQAITSLIKFVQTIYMDKRQTAIVEEALELYEQHQEDYPAGSFPEMDIAQCYQYLSNCDQIMKHAERAISFDGLTPKQQTSQLQRYIGMCASCYDQTEDLTYMYKILEATKSWERIYRLYLHEDYHTSKVFQDSILPRRDQARKLIGNYESKRRMEQEEDQILQEEPEVASQEPMEEPDQSEADQELATEDEDGEEQEEQVLITALPDLPELEEYTEYAEQEEQEEPAEPVEITPYCDRDGWDFLGLTKQDVVDYALNIPGEDRTAAILAYLKAGTALNPALGDVYHVVALAANDPTEEQDYSVGAMLTALEQSDPDYPELCDWCMGAAFLRTSFLFGREYDYSFQSLRDSISVLQTMPALRQVCDQLELFRKTVGCAVDIYADYRNHGTAQLMEMLNQTVTHAEELYEKFVVLPPRENAKFERLIATKKILFATEGELATLLRHMTERDEDAMEAEKPHFVATYLKGKSQFANVSVNINAVEELINQAWDQAGKKMTIKKVTSDLQGDRRNNLRFSVTEILRTACKWYALTEKCAGLTWWTEQGQESYLELRDNLVETLAQVSQACQEVEDDDPQRTTGAFLLGKTAQELAARLDGSWVLGQEKYTYVDFLRSDQILLKQDFMPDLSGTFCALPEFNVMARIRAHVEGEKLSFQAHVDQIFARNKAHNNYGTAQRIQEYLAAVGGEPVVLPERVEDFVSQTEVQMGTRYRSFSEEYKTDRSVGRIMQSDVFCDTLEATVDYWYDDCCRSKNYGFFVSLLEQARTQIRVSAQKYQEKLNRQLDALVDFNRQEFEQHPGYEKAVREQINEQRFQVAEDWMSKISANDFSMSIKRPEALDTLDDFWRNFSELYTQVADCGKSLSDLQERRNKNKDLTSKDTAGGQQLVDNWLRIGTRAGAEKISTLLGLLGWTNLQVEEYSFPGEPDAEIYAVKKFRSAAGDTTPQHPIAAFGSQIIQNTENHQNGMYVSCLYGVYDCDRLYEKIRVLDRVNGSKVILLDYAMGSADRRALARKMKQRESGLRNVYVVIDRVMLCYLADHYSENQMSRKVMAIGMPFAYCQPYVADSSHTMPPEIFIGRVAELQEIQNPTGANLLYGGRQLGKTALFKQARINLDGNQGQRAVMVEIKDCTCAAAARMVSAELIDLGILTQAEVTEDWNQLCRWIAQRLRSEEEKPISYLLLMLDEADEFIKDCDNFRYQPLSALKNVQSALPNRFKFVLAGLHNVAKFNRAGTLDDNSVIPHFPYLNIRPFQRAEAQELLTGPLSYLGFSLPRVGTVTQILATANYFPGLIQLYCQKLIESIRAADYAGYDVRTTPPYVVSDDHIRRVMADKDFVNQIREKFEITLWTDADQGGYYYPIALIMGLMISDSDSENGYSAKDVRRYAEEWGVQHLVMLEEEDIDILMQELVALNILRNVTDHTYLFVYKSFRDLLGTVDEILEKLAKIGEERA